MNRFLLAGLLFLLCFPSFGQSKKTDYTEMLNVIDLWLEAQREFDRLPGMSVAIVQDQDILFKKGYGYADMEKKTPMKPETLFSICSVSKLFTSVAIMQLWEQGKIRMDDTLSALLPQYKINQKFEDSVPITVRSLLTHSSGLTRDIDSSWNAPNYYFLKTDELKAFMDKTESLYPASTYFQYSNLGMSLLGEIVASKSGKSYNDYVEANILKPLQLGDTRPYLPKEMWRKELATGYGALDRKGIRKMQPFIELNSYTPAAGFSSNVIDLAKFASWQFRLLSGTGPEVLKPSTLKEMQRIQWISPDKKRTWGYGFFIGYDGSGSATIGHDGYCPGYVSVVTIEPKAKIGVSVMINSQGVSIYRYSGQIFSLLNKFNSIEADTTTKSIDLAEYQGLFDSYGLDGETLVMPVKGKLILLDFPTHSPADDISEYKYIKKDVFRKIRPDDKSLGEELVFERDGKGKVSRVRSFSVYMNRME